MATKRTDSIPVVFLRQVGPYWTVGPNITRVRRYMRAHGQTGRMFVRYLEDPVGASAISLTCEVGFVAAGGLQPEPPFERGELPSASVAYSTMVSPMPGRLHDYQVIRRWMRAHGYEAVGPIIEFYEPPPRAGASGVWRVEIQIPLRPRAAAAASDTPATADAFPAKALPGTETVPPSSEQTTTVTPSIAEDSASGLTDVDGAHRESGGPTEKATGPRSGRGTSENVDDLKIAGQPEQHGVFQRSAPPGEQRPPVDALPLPAVRSPTATGGDVDPVSPDGHNTAPSKRPTPPCKSRQAGSGNPEAPQPISELVTAGRFDRVAKRVVPDPTEVPAALRVWVGQLVYRIGAAARGVGQVYPGEGERLMAFATPIEQRYKRLSAAFGPDPLREALVRVDGESGPRSRQARAIMRDLDSLLGQIATRSVDSATVLSRLTDIAERAADVLCIARSGASPKPDS